MNLLDIEAAADRLHRNIIQTPVVDLRQTGLENLLPDGARVSIKLELLQKAGSFKARGCSLAMHALTQEQRDSGVVAASGGNHALAVAWAAQAAGVHAKIAVPKTADSIRLNGCRDLGAELVLCEDISQVFDTLHQIAKAEGRHILHPFESPLMSLGAATCGLEFHQSVPDMDIVILPVGGGGLISGMAAALKLSRPEIQVFGVEPFGADTMFRSFRAGSPQSIDKVNTIADSLGSPTALPYSYNLARKYVDDIVKVSDDDLRTSMRLMNTALKLMPEPACAASMAGMLGPLRDKCKGKRVGILACGSNISLKKFQALTA